MTFIRSTGTSFNNIGSPVTTASTGVGSDAEGTIAVGASRGTLTFFKVSSASPTNVEIRLFSDSARTKEVYKAPADASGNYDLSTPYIDKTPSFLTADDGTTLEADSLYYRISNNIGATTTFDLELIVEANR